MCEGGRFLGLGEEEPGEDIVFPFVDLSSRGVAYDFS